MEVINIKGLNLKTDDSIQEICKTSNATSGSTRSVLYIIVIVNILAFISVVNTFRGNWTAKRLEYYAHQISELKNRKINAFGNSLTEIEDSLTNYTCKYENTIKNVVETYQNVKVPILGNAFDVNNLGLIAGITMFILLVIFNFTLNREINNLTIALNAITERYPSDANAEDFKEFLFQKPQLERNEWLKLINYTRRKHHYNFLSMNEIFNCPPFPIRKEIDITLNNKLKIKTSRLEKFVMKMSWSTFLVLLLIVINDFITIDIGMQISSRNCIFGILLSLAFLIAVYKLCKKCTRQKVKIFELYNNFQESDYLYN